MADSSSYFLLERNYISDWLDGLSQKVAYIQTQLIYIPSQLIFFQPLYHTQTYNVYMNTRNYLQTETFTTLPPTWRYSNVEYSLLNVKKEVDAAKHFPKSHICIANVKISDDV